MVPFKGPLIKLNSGKFYIVAIKTFGVFYLATNKTYSEKMLWIGFLIEFNTHNDLFLAQHPVQVWFRTLILKGTIIFNSLTSLKKHLYRLNYFILLKFQDKFPFLIDRTNPNIIQLIRLEIFKYFYHMLISHFLCVLLVGSAFSKEVLRSRGMVICTSDTFYWYLINTRMTCPSVDG